ncbi:Hypothetical protein Cul210931_1743 [Corynebacterium ulcerans]|nr:Hypothetical protein Cul210931_1743 [Corynebacterium ulcerans]
MPPVLCLSVSELPPHARRKAAERARELGNDGTTSAYAEKSASSGVEGCPAWNYLRIRGEKGSFEHYRPADWELPPHTRRKGNNIRRNTETSGTTSAYAEKSQPAAAASTATGNYLRIR